MHLICCESCSRIVVSSRVRDNTIQILWNIVWALVCRRLSPDSGPDMRRLEWRERWVRRWHCPSVATTAWIRFRSTNMKWSQFGVQYNAITGCQSSVRREDKRRVLTLWENLFSLWLQITATLKRDLFFILTNNCQLFVGNLLSLIMTYCRYYCRYTLVAITYIQHISVLLTTIEQSWANNTANGAPIAANDRSVMTNGFNHFNSWSDCRHLLAEENWDQN